MKKLLLILCCTLLLLGCSAQEEAATTPSIPLDVCYSSATASQSVVMYAYEKGIFAKYGLDVNLTFIEGGSKATSALIAGEMDICQIAGSAIVNGVVAGSDLTLIAGLINTYEFSLMVRPEIESPADLQGKALAISSPGGSSDAATRAALQSFGLQPDEDVAILSIGGQSKRLSAMESGSVVGTVVGTLQMVQARELGYHQLANMAELELPFQQTALATSRQFVSENRTGATFFLQAIIDAIAQMKQDREGTIEVIAKYLLLDQQEEAAALEQAYTVITQDYLPDMPYPTVEGVQVQLDALVAENPAAADYTPQDVIDATLLEEIEKSGFRENLQP